MPTARITPAAVQVVRRSLELAGANPQDVGVRLRIAGGEVRPRFVQTPQASDVIVESDEIRVFVAHSIVELHGDVEIDVLPEHDQLVVRPLGSQP